ASGWMIPRRLTAEGSLHLLVECNFFAPGWLRSDRDGANYVPAWVQTAITSTGEGLVRARPKTDPVSMVSSSCNGFVGSVTMSKSLNPGVRGEINWKFLGLLYQASQVSYHSVQQGFPNAS